MEQETIKYSGKTLGSNKQQTIGRPKSNKVWKKGYRTHRTTRKTNPPTWEKKVEDRKKMKTLKERIK